MDPQGGIAIPERSAAKPTLTSDDPVVKQFKEWVEQLLPGTPPNGYASPLLNRSVTIMSGLLCTLTSTNVCAVGMTAS